MIIAVYSRQFNHRGSVANIGCLYRHLYIKCTSLLPRYSSLCDFYPSVKNKLIAFADGLAARLEKAARELETTETEIVRAGTALRLKEIEDEMARKAREKEERSARRRGSLLSSSSSPAIGLGITFDNVSAPPPPEPPPTPQQPQVVIVQQPQQHHAAPTHASNGSNGSTGGLVAQLAPWVAAASDYFEGVKRESTATDIIKAAVADQAERERLAQQLDDEVAALKRAKPASNPLSWLKKVVTG